MTPRIESEGLGARAECDAVGLGAACSGLSVRAPSESEWASATFVEPSSSTDTP